VKEIEVEFRRGPLVEAVHRVRAAVVEDGKLRFKRGDVDAPVFMRSSAKPMQALAVVESGAADAFGLSAEELAIVCGSHGAEDVHLAAVRSILRKAGVEASALRCGAHPPSSPRALKELHRAGEEPTSLHNNCSGKHAGMLAAAKRLGAPLESYLDAGHPLQKANRAAVERLCGVKRATLGVDGCGAPNFAVPLEAMARGISAFVRADGAARRVREAMTAHPAMVGRPCVVLMEAARGALVAKAGAEGVYLLGLPGSGAGIALKSLDGAARPLLHAIAALLRKLRPLPPDATARVVRAAEPVIRNHAGAVVGEVKVRLS